MDILWIYHPPSSSGKSRFIGISTKHVIILVVTANMATSSQQLSKCIVKHEKLYTQSRPIEVFQNSNTEGGFREKQIPNRCFSQNDPNKRVDFNNNTVLASLNRRINAASPESHSKTVLEFQVRSHVITHMLDVCNILPIHLP